MSDNTPTERFDAPVAGAPDDEAKRSRTLLYLLIGVGVLLLVTIVILTSTLLGRPASTTADPSVTPTFTESASATPTPTPTEESPSATPEPEESEDPPPPPPAPVPGFDSFSAPSDAGCQAGDDQKQLTFSWASDDAERAYIGVQTNNAKAAPFTGELPPVYTYTDIYFNCDQDSQYYTVTLEDGSGHLTHKTVTITD